MAHCIKPTPPPTVPTPPPTVPTPPPTVPTPPPTTVPTPPPTVPTAVPTPPTPVPTPPPAPPTVPTAVPTSPPTPPPPTPPTPPPTSSGDGTSAVAGGVAGGALLLGLGFLFMKRKQRRGRNDDLGKPLIGVATWQQQGGGYNGGGSFASVVGARDSNLRGSSSSLGTDSCEGPRGVDLLSAGSTELTTAQVHAATSGFAEPNMIDEGAFGAVYRGKISGLTVAIKLLKPEALLQEQAMLEKDQASSGGSGGSSGDSSGGSKSKSCAFVGKAGFMNEAEVLGKYRCVFPSWPQFIFSFLLCLFGQDKPASLLTTHSSLVFLLLQQHQAPEHRVHARPLL